jgi:sec-independent protein translocase protein TatA
LTGPVVRGTISEDRLVRMESSMFGLGAWELFIVLAIVVVLFGARRLPEIGSGMGKAIKNFKSGISGKDEIDVTPEKEEISEGKNQS